MKDRVRVPVSGAQAGVVLVMVLLFALLLNFVAASLVQTAALQVRMSTNGAFYQEALLLADGIARRVIEGTAQFSPTVPVGEVRCPAQDTRAECTALTLPPLDRVPIPDGLAVDFSIERLRPAQQWVPASVLAADADATDGPVSVALFEISVQVAARARSGVSVQLAWGVAVPLAGGKPVRVYWRERGADTL